MHLRFTKRKFGWYRITFSSLRVRLVRHFMSLKAQFENSKFCFAIATLYIYILQILILNSKYNFVIAYSNAPLSSLQVKYYYLPKVKWNLHIYVHSSQKLGYNTLILLMETESSKMCWKHKSLFRPLILKLQLGWFYTNLILSAE